MATKKCPNCGLENPASATICECGYDFPEGEVSTVRVDPDPQVDTDGKSKPKSVKQVLAIALGILFILFGAPFLLGGVVNLIAEGRLDFGLILLEIGLSSIIGGVWILRVSRTQRKVLLVFLGTLLLVSGGAIFFALIAEEGLTESLTFYLLARVVMVGILPMIGGLSFYRMATQKGEETAKTDTVLQHMEEDNATTPTADSTVPALWIRKAIGSWIIHLVLLAGVLLLRFLIAFRMYEIDISDPYHFGQLASYTTSPLVFASIGVGIYYGLRNPRRSSRNVVFAIARWTLILSVLGSLIPQRPYESPEEMVGQTLREAVTFGSGDQRSKYFKIGQHHHYFFVVLQTPRVSTKHLIAGTENPDF